MSEPTVYQGPDVFTSKVDFLNSFFWESSLLGYGLHSSRLWRDVVGIPWLVWLAIAFKSSNIVVSVCPVAQEFELFAMLPRQVIE